jgi:DNA-binding PadR family transcriptional regulator
MIMKINQPGEGFDFVPKDEENDVVTPAQHPQTHTARPHCCRQPDCERPCACAMGKVSRFIEPLVLRILSEKKKSYGYEIAALLPEYALTDATIESAALYRTLRTLEANGHVRSSWEAGDGPARRSYSLTNTGQEHLREWAELLRGLGTAMTKFAKDMEDGKTPAGKRA